MYHSRGARPSDETIDWLSSNGCTVVEGEELGHNCEPVGNKIVAVNTPVETDYSLWIDTDMYVLDTPMFEALLDREVDVAAVGPEYGFQGWAGPEDVSTWNAL